MVRLLFVSLLSIYCLSAANAGFLDMPDILEPPDFERESLLRDLDIPSVLDRDPDPQSGPRLAIAEFRLQGIIEYPELGITREALEKLVEKMRFELMEEGELLDSGYTLDELAEISNLLIEIEKETAGQHVGPLEVQRLVWLIRDQRSLRGVTLGMIETVADAVAKYYRDRGFIFAEAYIPAQKVRDGVVALTVLLGTLGEVEVTNNKVYRDRTVSAVFDDITTKPLVNRMIEERLYLVNDLPGFTAEGFFQPGTQVGDTKLKINALREKRFAGNIRIDNHGSDQTGENRLYGDFFWNNPAGLADQLQLGVLRTANPGNTTYGAIRYSLSLFSRRFRMTAGASNNDFVLGPGNSESQDTVDFDGKSTVFDVGASYVWHRSRERNETFTLTVENIESTLRVSEFADLGDIGLDDEVRNIVLGYDFDFLQQKQRFLHQGNARLIIGDFLKGADENQDEQYQILAADYSFLRFWRLPGTKSETRVLVRTSLQLASSALSSINQFSLGGPTRARGYSVNQFFGDSAWYVGADWLFNTPKFLDFKIGRTRVGDWLRPFVFADFTYGRAEPLVEGEDGQTGQFSNLGVGLKIEQLGNFDGNLQFAFPMTGDISPDDAAVEDESLRIYFDLQYRF